jgi:hypothetical protein
MRSQLYTGELWSVSQYNANNGWIFNGNNGTVNNNNKYNGNISARVLDCNLKDFDGLEEFNTFIDSFYDAYYECRKSKRNKSAQLEFEYHFAEKFIDIVLSVFICEYVPDESIFFIVPPMREVGAAYFGDRVVQTWYVNQLRPFMENEWLDPDSYSCREGKGGLRAVHRLREYIAEATNGYIYDAWIVKRDVRAFFMSIDTKVLVDELEDFIYQHFGMEPDLRERLCYLTRIIYQSQPQDHCVLRSHPLAWRDFDPRKTILNRNGYTGIPIGNHTSQMAANFYTGFYIAELRKRGYRFVHYTDDTAIVVTDREQWKIDEKEIERLISEKLHLEWHTRKKYYQHHSKGVTMLGYKLRFDRILPSDRVAHNFIWKTRCAAMRAVRKPDVVFTEKETFMATFNSYCGLLKWCDAKKLVKSQVELLKGSYWTEVYDIYENKVNIKKNRTRLSWFGWKNKIRKKAMKEERSNRKY